MRNGRVEMVNKAMNAKLYWRLLHELNVLWSKGLNAKYLGNEYPEGITKKSTFL
jgi:hypothetical protein